MKIVHSNKQVRLFKESLTKASLILTQALTLHHGALGMTFLYPDEGLSRIVFLDHRHRILIFIFTFVMMTTITLIFAGLCFFTFTCL